MAIEDWKNLAEAGQAVATTVALLLGGWWTYLLFVKKREHLPRARVVHGLKTVGTVGSGRIIRLTLRVESLGSVLLALGEAEIRLQGLWPLPPSWTGTVADGKELLYKDKEHTWEFDWPEIKAINPDLTDYEIEPQESEEFHFDFLIASDVEVVQVYSYIANRAKKNNSGRQPIGWNCTTLHSLKEERENGEKFWRKIFGRNQAGTKKGWRTDDLPGSQDISRSKERIVSD